MLTNEDIKALDWEKTGGLIPAVVQDACSGRVLMLGCMNPEALEKTLETKKVTFWSRTKGRLWTKGETSGNWLHLVDIGTDCDSDALLVLVNPDGPTCHRGTPSCFSSSLICLVTAGCVMNSSSAARVKLSLSATARKTFSRKSVIIRRI